MLELLGTRKRRSGRSSSQTSPQHSGSYSSSPERVQEAFRRHFEAQFKPLESVNVRAVETSTPTQHTDSESEWDGFSEPEDIHTVEVVEYTAPPKSSLFEVPKEELKSFMVYLCLVIAITWIADSVVRSSKTSKPPSSSLRSAQPYEPKPTEDSDDATDVDNLRNDLALQRLLNESHLLDSQSSYSPMGANRHKANDLRLQALGSKSSIFRQDKMPMSHRKGIIAKASEREERRRREARENGIILEKVKKARKVHLDRRERSIDRPGVGTFRKGMLRLNRRDVAEIEEPKRPGGRARRGLRR